jgi:transcriptional regulator with XRE-family HTH domain
MQQDLCVSTKQSDYFTAKTGERSVRAIAEKAGLDQSTLNRQLNGTNGLRVETVVAICRAYDLDILDVFVAVGFITEEESREFASHASLSDISDLELSKEMLRRVAAGSATTAITEPAPEALIDDVLREVENAREQGKKSNWATAADARRDRTPGADGDDPRVGI